MGTVNDERIERARPDAGSTSLSFRDPSNQCATHTKVRHGFTMQPMCGSGQAEPPRPLDAGTDTTRAELKRPACRNHDQKPYLGVGRCHGTVSILWTHYFMCFSLRRRNSEQHLRPPSQRSLSLSTFVLESLVLISLASSYS